MNRLILSFFAAILFSLVNQPALAQGVAPDSIDIEYAKIDTISLKLDVYLPKNVNPPYPVIVWIHGGGWRTGSKENARAGFMVNFGYAVVEHKLSLLPTGNLPGTDLRLQSSGSLGSRQCQSV